MDTPNSRDRLRLKNMGEELLEKKHSQIDFKC